MFLNNATHSNRDRSRRKVRACLSGRSFLKLWVRLSLLCVLFLFVAGSASAVDPSRLLSQYGHTAWRAQDGFFTGRILGLTQTPDGYIWIGTQTGLLRFDGVRLVPWTPPSGQHLPSSSITSLLTARDGSLWIGTVSGLSHWVNQKLINVNAQGPVIPTVEDRNGTIWFGLLGVEDISKPLCQVIGTGVRCYGKAEGIQDNNFAALAADPQGTLWIGRPDSVVRWNPNSYSVYPLRGQESKEGQAGVLAFAANPDGSTLVGIDSRGTGLGLQQLVRGAWRPFKIPEFDGTTMDVTALFSDRQGSLWIGTNKAGIYRVHGQKAEHFGSADGLSGDLVFGFYEDREGNLWVLTSKGVDLFHDLRVATFSTHEGLTSGEVDSVFASRDGTVWVGEADALDALLEGRPVSSIRTAKGLPGNQADSLFTSLFEDHAGRFWVGVDQTLSIYKNGQFTQVKRNDSSRIGFVTGITEDIDNNIWVEVYLNSTRRLLRIRDFKVVEEFPAPQIPAARKVAPDPRGGIWLGLMSGDLARFKQGHAETFHFVRTQDADVEQIMVNPDGSVLGATAFGLIGWKDGRRQILTVRNGLPCDGVHSLVRDDHNALWLYTQCGLVEIADTEIQRWWEQPDAKLQLRIFDAFDGAQPGHAFFNGATKSTDGRLWFAGGGLLQMIDPAHVARDMVPPPVHIEEIVADQKTYSPQEQLQLPPLTRDLEVDYTALSFALPQRVRFRYKLEGHDARWQEPGTRRQAFYTDLRPGKYRFRVIASKSDGVWNEQGATLDFSIAPAWYQTSSFVVLCIVSGILILCLLYQLRMRQIASSISACFDERLAERTRLARDLHDTLLQTLQGSKLAADGSIDGPADPVRMRETMEQLSGWLGQAMRELRAALDSLRASTTQKNDLAAAFQRSVDDCVNRRLIEATLVVEGLAPEMHPIVRDEIYRIGYEAIRNASAHSGGSILKVKLCYSQDLTLTVEDNGKGIEPDISTHGKAGHFGLQGMRERAKRVGGRLTLSSSADSGTRIELIVPGSIIFLDRRPKWRAVAAKIRNTLNVTDRTIDLG